MPETMLTVSQVAALLEIGERAVQKNALAGKYGPLLYTESAAGGGAGGKAIRISLDALPETYQARYIQENDLGSDEKSAGKVTDYDKAPAWARQRANRNHAILAEYEAFLLQPGKKTTLSQDFARRWSQEHPEESISASTLCRWQREYQKKGISALLPQYGQNKGKHFAISDTLMVKFIQMLKDKKPISSCHDVLKVMAIDNGESCPSEDTLRRIAKELPMAVLVAIQQGKKAFYNQCQTFTRRDPESVRAGQVFVGDHRMFDFSILGPRGTWVRPWVTAWMDMRSTKLVGWIITLTPNSQTITASFVEAALDPAIGLPREIYIDNGKDYCNEYFAGRGWREKHQAAEAETSQRVVPMMERLGIIVHNAIPENARAKTIERNLFRNMSTWFDHWFATYCGSSVAKKPEKLADKLKGEKNKVKYNITLEQLKEIFDGYARNIYNKRASERGKGREGECPDETFIRTRLPVRQTTEAVLQHFLQKKTGRYKVGRNGITFRGREYYSNEMMEHKFKDVIISCRDSEPDKIYVFDLDERPLFTAEAIQLRDATKALPEEMHAEGSRKSAEWEAVKAHPVYQAAQSGNAPSMAEIVALFQKHGPKSPDPKPTTVTEMVPAPAALRDAIRWSQATGTDGMSVFEMVAGVQIESRRGDGKHG